MTNLQKTATNFADKAMGGTEAISPMILRTGTVFAVNKTKSVWTIDVILSDTVVPDITFLGWMDPRPGDVVQILEQGPTLLGLGMVGPGNPFNKTPYGSTGIVKTVPPSSPFIVVTVDDQDISATFLSGYTPSVGHRVRLLWQPDTVTALGQVGVTAAPPPPAPAPPPPPPPVPPAQIREVSVTAVGSETGPSEAPLNGWRGDRLYQGGGVVAQRSFWYYGNKIAEARGSGTILGGTILIKRMGISAGVGGAASVRLGSHPYGSRPGGFPGLQAVYSPGALGRDQAATFSLSGEIIDRMNAGSAVGLGLEPGAMGYLSSDYLVAYAVGPGTEWSGALTLTIRG